MIEESTPYVTIFVPAAFGDMEDEAVVRKYAAQREFRIDPSWVMVPIVERRTMLVFAGNFIEAVQKEGTRIEVVDSSTWLVRKTCTHADCVERGHTMTGHLRVFVSGSQGKAN